jgi:hypothetical protein
MTLTPLSNGVESAMTEAIHDCIEELQSENRKCMEEAVASRDKSSQSQIGRILDYQEQEAREKVVRERRVTRLITILIFSVISAAGGTGAMLARSPTNEEISQPVVDMVKATESSLTKRVEESEKKIQRLGESVIEQQVQISDGFDYIADKIDAAHPRQKGDVDIRDYPTVEAAKRKADHIKMQKGVEKLFAEEPGF